MVIAADLSAWSETAWAAAGTWVTAGIYVVIGVVAFSQVREARRLRLAQSRPFVVVDLEQNVERIIVDVIIRNVGQTVARNVRLSFDKPVTSTIYDSGLWLGGQKAAMLVDGIATFPPGKRMTAMLDSVPARVKSKLDMIYTVTVDYDGPEVPRLWRKPRAEHHRDTYVLDLAPLLGVRNVNPRTVHHVAKSLEALQREMAKWTDGSRGLLVNSLDRNRETVRNERSLHLSHARGLLTSRGPRAVVEYYVRLWRDRRGFDWMR